MDEQTLALTFKSLNKEIEELINTNKQLKQKMIVIIKKIDKLEEYAEIQDMRNAIIQKQLNIINRNVNI